MIEQKLYTNEGQNCIFGFSKQISDNVPDQSFWANPIVTGENDTQLPG